MLRWLISAVIGVAFAVGGFFALSLVRAPAEQAPAASLLPPATATVTRGRLVDTRTVTGTLGYDDPAALSPAASEAETITWLAPVDAIVERGQPIYAIESEPAVLLYGAMPQYRTLRFDGETFADAVWVELETMRSDLREAELTLDLERERLAQAETALDEATARLADSESEDPATPELSRLVGAVRTAENQLARTVDLHRSNVAPTVQLEAAEAALATARADLDRAVADLRQEVAVSSLDRASARVAVAKAERLVEDLTRSLRSLEARADDDADIRQIAENLTALGYDGTAAEMVRSWQEHSGHPATGIVAPGQVVVTPGPIRIAEHQVEVGNVLSDGPSDNDAILTYTTTEREVTVALAVADQHLVGIGRTAIVTRPDGVEVEGVIAEVGSVVTNGEIEVTIAIADQAALGSLNAAAVDVDLVSAERDDVLSVPVAALLALPDGGFGVEIVEGSSSRIMPIEAGMFASGRVEVSGDAIAEGVVVGVPR